VNISSWTSGICEKTESFSGQQKALKDPGSHSRIGSRTGKFSCLGGKALVFTAGGKFVLAVGGRLVALPSAVLVLGPGALLVSDESFGLERWLKQAESKPKPVPRMIETMHLMVFISGFSIDVLQIAEPIGCIQPAPENFCLMEHQVHSPKNCLEDYIVRQADEQAN
jgi:hypothetical protein